MTIERTKLLNKEADKFPNVIAFQFAYSRSHRRLYQNMRVCIVAFFRKMNNAKFVAALSSY